MTGEDTGRERVVNDKMFPCGSMVLDPPLLELWSADITHAEEGEKITSGTVPDLLPH